MRCAAGRKRAGGACVHAAMVPVLPCRVLTQAAPQASPGWAPHLPPPSSQAGRPACSGLGASGLTPPWGRSGCRPTQRPALQGWGAASVGAARWRAARLNMSARSTIHCWAGEWFFCSLCLKACWPAQPAPVDARHGRPVRVWWGEVGDGHAVREAAQLQLSTLSSSCLLPGTRLCYHTPCRRWSGERGCGCPQQQRQRTGGATSCRA